jgi:hypothetical protein
VKRAVKLLLAGLVLAVGLANRHPDRMPTWDLALLCSFDRGDVSDRSLGRNTGTLQGNAAVSSRALVLDGTGDYVSFPDASILDVPSAFTVSLWFEPSSPSGTRIFLAKYNSTGNQRSFQIWADYAANLYQGIVSSNGALASNYLNYRWAGSIPTTGWNHLAWVVDPSLAGSGVRMRLYINGAVRTVNNNFGDASGITALNNAEPLCIGADSAGNNNWKGNLDDVRLYRRALSAAEVGAIFSSGRQQ